MFPKKVIVMGMELERWEYKSCVADFGVGDDWATLYSIESSEKGKGHATKLLIAAKKYYENLGKRFGGTVALNDTMQRLYKKLNILEYDEANLDSISLEDRSEHGESNNPRQTTED